MKLSKCALGLACLFVIGGHGFGQDVNLVTRFAAWNDPAAWSDGLAAGAGKNYVVGATGKDLASPRTFGPVFRGDSLTIQADGNLELRHRGGSASVPSLTLAGGAITHGTGRTVGVGGAAQVINVSGDSRIVVVRNSQILEVRSRLTGSGALTALGGSVEPGTRATIALLGIGSDYTGAWTVENVTLQAVTPGSMGSGNVLITEGTLDFDYRYHNLAGTLTIDGAESRLNLDQDVAFGEVFFGQTKIPDGVHPWSFFSELGAGEQIIDGGGRLIIGDQDADDDGMSDVLETELFGDTSKSADGDEDGDGLSNLAEVTGNSDPTKADTDGDGLDDAAEVAAGSNPNTADTDGDGLTDAAEVTTHQTSPRSADTDGDSVSDGDEVANGTNPLLADTDGDGFDDGTELGANSDANDANDKPSGSFIPAQIEAGNPVLLPVVFGGGEAIATAEANMALNTREPEILFVTTATDGTGLTDPLTGEEPLEAVVGFFMDPRTLEQTRDPFVILGNPDGGLNRLDVKYNPVSGQYIVVSGAQAYRPNGQVVPLIALVNPNSVAGADHPVAKTFAYDSDTTLSYDDVAVAVSSNNGNILLVAEYKFAGEGEGVVGAMLDSEGNELTSGFTRLDRLQATGDEDDPDVLFLPQNDVFVFLVNTDGAEAPDLLDRITGSIIGSAVNADGTLQLGDQVVLGADRKEGVPEGHPAAIENPFTNELIGAFDYDNGAQGGDIFYFQVGAAPDFQLTTTRDQIPYLDATGSNPYAQRHPQLAADPNSGVIVIGHHVRSSAADPPLPNGYALTALGPDGAVLPGRSEENHGFHAFIENEADTDNDANWTNVKYDPISDSLIVVFADSAGETKVVRFTVISNHLEQDVETGPLVAHWSFEGDAQDQAGSNHGTLEGGATFADSFSGLGQALSLDGVDDYVATTDLDLEFITIAAWVNALDGDNQAYVLNKNFDGSAVPYSLNVGGNNLAEALDGLAWFTGGWKNSDLGAGGDLRGAGWHHVAGTYDGTTLKYFVDGVLLSSSDEGSGPLPQNDNVLDIGRYLNDDDYFGGLIDDLRIYNVAISDAEVAALYAESPKPSAAPAGALFREDFEGLTLGPNVDEGVAGEMVWTKEPPTNWVVDNSKLFGADEEGVGVTEWKGWTFATKEWWIEAAGDQRRSEWLSGKGTVAIADPDEWDDLGSPGAQEPGGFETYLSTPPIDLTGLSPNTAVLSFDSSWRPEFDDNYHQSGNLRVSFDGGEAIELFEWLSDPGSPNFKGEAIDEKVIVPLNNPEGAKQMVITFGMFDAGNDWWWAIDNIEVATGAVLSRLLGRRSSVTLELTDTGSSKIDAATVILQIDGQTVSPNVTTVDGVIRIVYEPTPPFVSGSTHTYNLSATDEAGAPIQFDGEFDVPVPVLPEDALPGPPAEEGEFGVRYIWGGGTLNNIGAAANAILAVQSGEWEGTFFDTTHSYINHGDGNGLFPEDDLYPDEVEGDEEGLWTDEDFLQFSRATIRVAEGGEFTFGVQTDDGFALRIFGATFTSVTGQGVLDPGNANTMAHPGTTGNSSTRGTVTLARGDYDLEFLWFERGGGDFGELYVAKGAFVGDGDTDTWQLLGKPADGEEAVLTLVGSPLATPTVLDIGLAGNESIVSFTTPEPNGNHELQRSVDLIAWEPDSAAVLSDAGNGVLQFTTAKGAEPQLHYRVGLLPPPPIYSTDFENGVEGWEVLTDAGDTAWELGTPNAGGLTTAASGTMAWGTNVAGNYTPNSVTALRSPVIDLTGIGRPKLSFNYFIDSVQDVEGGQLRFLNEAGEVLFTRDEVFSGTTEDWTPFNLTVPREVRDQAIIIEFRLLADGDDNVGAGWYIDDVIVDR